MESSHIEIESVMLMLESPEEARSFLAAILSDKENQQVRKRWEAYQLRTKGLPVAKVKEAAGVSTTTASRAAALRNSPLHVILDALIARARGGLQAAN